MLFISAYNRLYTYIRNKEYLNKEKLAVSELHFFPLNHLYHEASWSDAKKGLLHNPFFFLSPYMLSSRSHRVARSELLQPEPRRVDRTGTRVDEDVVEEASKRAAKKWCHHRDLDMVRKN